MIEQGDMYGSACRKSVTLPIVENDKDYWYCRRLISEALIAMRHRDGGPVQINIPTEWGLFAQNFNTKELPALKPIRLYTRRDLSLGVREPIEVIRAKRKILVIVGQGWVAPEEDRQSLELFADKYPCAVAVETISNMRIRASVNTSLICRALTKDMFLEYAPDLVISVGGNYISPVKGLLKGCSADFEHWCVNEDGRIVDQFRKQTGVFDCSAHEFFNYFNKYACEDKTDHSYYNLWERRIAALPRPDFPYSSNYVMQEFLKRIPKDSLLHHGNGVAVHIAQYFPTDPSIITYCHSGTTTIDGSLSAFIGQASVSKKLCFAFIGDLSFFYDMNAIWNRYVGKNVRILLYNNEGGQTFHWNNARDIDTLPLHTSAEHFTSAKGWVESRGFKYISARNKDEFDALLPEFVATEADRPICFEVFTKKDSDARYLHEYYAACRSALQATSPGKPSGA